MEVRVGEWYLCEGYIDEPVQIKTVESNRIEVLYLSSGKLKWLGYPKIWQACGPHALPGELDYDPISRLVTLRAAGAEQPLTLAQLRARHLPKSARRRPCVQPVPVVQESAAPDWSADDPWITDSESEAEEADYELESED